MNFREIDGTIKIPDPLTKSSRCTAQTVRNHSSGKHWDGQLKGYCDRFHKRQWDLAWSSGGDGKKRARRENWRDSVTDCLWQWEQGRGEGKLCSKSSWDIDRNNRGPLGKMLVCNSLGSPFPSTGSSAFSHGNGGIWVEKHILKSISLTNENWVLASC